MTLRRSPQTVQLLAELLTSPQEWRYGYDLSRNTGLKSGTLYPILMRLAERGLLETSWETVEAGRPPRHLYKLTGEGLRIFTTLDVHMQRESDKAVSDNLARLEAQHSSLRRKEKKEELQSCLVAIEPQTGKIRAMTGGRDYRESQFNRVIQSKRQP